MLCGDLDGWDGVGWGGREIQEGGDIGTHIADSLRCTAETNNIVKQLYSKRKQKKAVRWMGTGRLSHHQVGGTRTSAAAEGVTRVA